jgi:5-methylcytosine-specific restriction protein A
MNTRSPAARNPSPADGCAATPAPTAVLPVEAGAGTTSPTTRTLNEWVGSSPNAKIPARVRVRVFERHSGRCHLTGRRIRAGEAWECDHVIALINGGEHRETNLAPALSDAHRIKTKSDVREKAKVARIRKRHLGIKAPRSIRSWRRFDGTIVHATRDR